VSVRTAVATFRGHRLPQMDLVGRRRVWFALSGLFLVVSLAGLLIRQLNLSLEFEGGAELRFPNRTDLTVEEVRSILDRYGRGEAEVQIVGEGDVTITTETLEELGERGDQLLVDLAGAAGISVDEINRSEVGPTFGSQIAGKALRALIVFLVLVTIYIALRFEWKMAFAAQAALLHDLVITAGVYALIGQEVTPATVIAILTILGYSLYDTVVIFDKVNENTESMGAVAREGYGGVVNRSLNETFMRSVNTSLVVVFPILALLLFGGETLKDFAFALLVGVLCSTYSSIFFAVPVFAVLKEREPKIARLSGKGPAATKAPARGRPAVARGAAASTEQLEPAGTASAPASGGGGSSGGRPSRSGSRPSGSRPKSKRKPPPKRRRR
jgi:preprotein translocase subunit SecF